MDKIDTTHVAQGSTAQDAGFYKKEFEEIFASNIKREGADKLLEYIRGSDFYTAPASTRFHSNFAGGLLEHSVKVYKRFKTMVKSEFGEDYMKKEGVAESLAIIGLLHDVCKIGYYKSDFRNVKENGVWLQKPVFIHDDPLPYGHGEKSVYMLSAYMRLTREEAMAINWHMGPFDDRVRGGNFSTLGKAFQMYPLALLFHSADMLTSYLDERIIK